MVVEGVGILEMQMIIIEVLFSKSNIGNIIILDKAGGDKVRVVAEQVACKKNQHRQGQRHSQQAIFTHAQHGNGILLTCQ